MRSRAVLVVVALALVLLVPAGVGAQVQSEQPLGPVLVLAHRGASSYAPEHTFFAYDQAVEADSDFLECDLQLSADEVLVCVHDTTVDRTSDGAGRVDAFTLAELRALDFGTWFNDSKPEQARPEYAGAAIVPFEEQLDCYLGINPRIRFHIETKAPSEYDGKMEPLLVDLLREKGLVPAEADAQTSQVIVQSFELESLQAVKQLEPAIPTAYLSVAPQPEYAAGALPPYVDVAAPSAVYLAANPQFPRLAHDQGHEVHTYTIDDPDQMDFLLDIGVDGIFTNRPDVLRERIDARDTGTTHDQRGNPEEFPHGCPGVAGSVTAAGASPTEAAQPTPAPGATESQTEQAKASESERLEGETAVEAALALSRFAFDEATDVLLARDDLFADSLASGTLQGILDGPLLLTASDDLDDDVAAELERLQARRVHILGGPAAVSTTVATELTTRGYAVDRIAGASRTETAIAAAQTLLTTPTTAVIAPAYPGPGDPTTAFADALAAGAYGAATDTPVLLTSSDGLTATTSEYLETSPIEQVYVAGGVDAVSDQVVADIRELGITVERVDGADRSETAVGFAELLGMDTAAEADTIVLAEGFDPLAWAPGFAAASVARTGDVALVLADGESLPASTSDFLDGGGAALVCAPLVTEQACTEAEGALAG